MKAAIFAYSHQGCITARKADASLLFDEVSLYAPCRLNEQNFISIPIPSAPVYSEQFHQSDALIFVGSCGIALRQIAPYITSKQTDPAVIVIDELGQFVIPLLSGHIGGANALAGKLAKVLGAMPVITTATDINHRFSVDTWATENGFIISDLTAAKKISAAILEGDVPLCSDFPVSSALPAGVLPGSSGPLGIYLTMKTCSPFDIGLRLIPRILHLGIGCRKGTSAQNIEEGVRKVLADHSIDFSSIKSAASIDLKAQEPGLLEFCQLHRIETHFYSAEELSQVPGSFSSSAFVKKITGVDNVCQRAAMLEAPDLIIEKTTCCGITVAAAAEHLEVRFG